MVGVYWMLVRDNNISVNTFCIHVEYFITMHSGGGNLQSREDSWAPCVALFPGYINNVAIVHPLCSWLSALQGVRPSHAVRIRAMELRWLLRFAYVDHSRVGCTS